MCYRQYPPSPSTSLANEDVTISITTIVMMMSSNGNIFRVTGSLCREFTCTGEFPAQRPVTRSFDVFFDLRLNKKLGKQPWGWWFETPWRPLCRHCNVSVHNIINAVIKLIFLSMWVNIIMSAMASQLIGISTVYWAVCSGEDQRKHQSTAWLAFVRSPVTDGFP